MEATHIRTRLTCNGLIISENDLASAKDSKYVADILRTLTLRTPVYGGGFKVSKVYIRHDGTLTLPRNILKKLYKEVRMQLNIEFISHPIQAEWDGELYDNQRLIIDNIMLNYYNDEAVKQGLAHVVLNLRAGFGKTFIASYLITQLKQRTLYIVPNKLIAGQAIDDMQIISGAKIWTGSPAQWKKLGDATPDIVVMVINSALLMNEDFFKLFGFVIFDEIHTMCADSRAKIFFKCGAMYMLGMSATTDERQDKFDRIYKLHFGDVMYSHLLKGWDDGVQYKGVVNRINYRASAEYSNIYNGASSFIPNIKQIIADPDRNKLCVKLIMEQFNAGKFLYVFTEYLEHIEILDQMVSNAIKEQRQNDAKGNAMEDMCHTSELMILKGGSKYNAKATTRVIITTYGYSGTGLSIQRMNAAVFATPRKNGFKQICGRIMRRGSDPDIERVIVDIVDVNTTLMRQKYERKNAYSYYGFPINDIQDNQI